jgi:hypothetical protein
VEAVERVEDAEDGDRQRRQDDDGVEPSLAA